jgi:hypothetical protein
MKKKYVTARLFKKQRATNNLINNDQITNKKLNDSEQQQSSQEQDNSEEKYEIQSEEKSNGSSLSQRYLKAILKLLKALGI